MRWLTQIPRGLVRAHLRMVPRLLAEESLLDAQRMMVGTGSLARGAAKDLVREWHRTANPGGRAERPTSRGALKLWGGTAGIGYREVTAR